MSAKTTLSDVIAGHEPGATKRWRFEDEVPAPKDAKYTKLQPDTPMAKSIADHLGIPKIGNPAPTGHLILGFRDHGWRRPLVVKDGDGKSWFMSEAGVRRYFKKKA